MKKKTAAGKMRISSYINLVSAPRRLVPAQTDIHHGAKSIPVAEFVILSESILCSQAMSVDGRFNVNAGFFMCVVFLLGAKTAQLSIISLAEEVRKAQKYQITRVPRSERQSFLPAF